jgi:hypothetical protein
MDQPTSRQFASDEDIDKYVLEKADDIDSIRIFIQSSIPIARPDGTLWGQMNGVGGQLKFCGKDSATIDPQAMERLINSGKLHRMGIKIELVDLNHTRPSPPEA